MRLEWQDSTTYSRGRRGSAEPTAFSIRFGDIEITVTSGHIDYPGKWVVVSRLLGSGPIELKDCDTPKLAKRKAVLLVGHKVNAMNDAMKAITAATS